jgi:hypothetical protein
MGIELRGEIPGDCTLVNKNIVFRMFDGKCQNLLKTFPDSPTHTNPFKNFCARADRKESYMEFETGNQIPICDPNNIQKPYSKKGYMLRMKTKKGLLCPWNNPPFSVLFQAQYGESLNPTFPVLSPWLETIIPWPENQSSISLTLTTESIGDPFEHGSSGIGSADMTLYLEYDDPSNTCIDPSLHSYAHLNTLGLPIHWLAGPPIDQWKQISSSCFFFEHGWTPMDNYWTGAYYYAGPLGVVMNLFIRAWGIWES